MTRWPGWLHCAALCMWIVSSPAAQITPETPSPSFGHALGLADSLLIVGDPAHHGGAGRISVYQLMPSGTWTLTSSVEGVPGDSLGTSVSTDGLHVVSGAPGARSACFFALADAVIREQGCIQGTDRGNGRAVALSGAFAAVGDPMFGSQRGRVTTFALISPGTWTQRQIVSGEAEGDAFGYVLDMNRETLVVGAPSADEPRGDDAGLVYVYRRTSGSDWVERATLTGGNAGFGHRFGATLAVGAHRDTTRLVVGAPGASLAYLFSLRPDGVEQADFIRPVPPQPDLDFARSVAVQGNVMLVGAPSRETGTRGAVWVLRIDRFFQLTLAHTLFGTEAFGRALDANESRVVVATPGSSVDVFKANEALSAAVPNSASGMELFPNPFATSLTLRFDPSAADLIRVFDPLAREVAVLRRAGRTQLTWTPSALAPGVYTIVTDDQVSHAVLAR